MNTCSKVSLPVLGRAIVITFTHPKSWRMGAHTFILDERALNKGKSFRNHSNWIWKRKTNQRSSCQHPLIIETARGFQKIIYICSTDYAKVIDSVDHSKLWIILKEKEIPDHLTCLLRNLYAGKEATVRTWHETMDWLQIGKGVRQGCHPTYLTSMQSTSWEMSGWMKHKLESRLPGEISITSDTQMTPPLWQKAKRNERAFWWKWKRRVKKLT